MNDMASSSDDEESSDPGFQSHVYFELTDLAPELNRPLQRFRHQRRLQYTCCDVFATEDTVYMALGTTSGSVYLFHSNGQRVASGRCSPSSGASFHSVPQDTSILTSTTSNNMPVLDAGNTWQHLLTVIAEDVIGSVNAVAFLPPTPDQMSPLAPDTRSIMSDESEISLRSGQSTTLSMRRNASYEFDQERVSIDSNWFASSNLYLSFGTSKGHLIIAHITRRSMVPATTNNLLPIAQWRSKSFERHWRIVYHCKTFTNDPVLLLRWQHFNRLFLVDQAGQLFLLQNVHECFSNIIFQPLPVLLMNLNGVGICQMDVCEQFMLFSTTDQRIYFFDYNSMECRQIGKQGGQAKRKQKNEKLSGVCIISTYHWEDSDHDLDQSDRLHELFDEEVSQCRVTHQLYVTRPKWRLWVVDHFGQVQFTQQFCELVHQNAITPMTGDQKAIEGIFEQQCELSSTGFERLYPMLWRDPDSLTSLHDDFSPQLLVTYSDTPDTRLFVIDPNQQAILASTAPLKGQIIDLKCLGRDIYVTYRTETKGLQVFVLELCVENHIDEDRIESTEVQLQGETPAKYILDLENNLSKPIIIIDEAEVRERAQQKQFRDLLIRVWNCLGFIDEICWTCSCGLPVADQINTHQLINANLEVMQPLISALDNTQQRQLMSVAATRHNWPLFFTLLIQLQECKLYLYYAILLDQRCLINRAHNLFNSDTVLRQESTWKDLIEYLCLYLSLDDSNQSILEVPLEPIHLSPHLPSNARIVSTTTHCKLCKLKNEIQKYNAYKPLFAFLERKILPNCFLYTSPDFIISLLKLVLNKLFASSDGAPIQTYLVSGNFFQLLLRFKLLYLGTNAKCRTLLDELSTTNNSSNVSNVVSSYKELPLEELEKIFLSKKFNPTLKQHSQRGLVLNLRDTSCAFCHKPIFPARARGQPLLRKQIKLYRTCGHVYHNTCTLLSRACWLCSQTSVHKTLTSATISN